LGYGSQWIYVNGTDSWSDGYTAVFQTLFNSICPQSSAVLTITADDVFIATLNGHQISSGNDWKTKYQFPINNLECGLNNLTIEVINHFQGTPASLIFAITQTQINCYQCGPYADYNFNTCQCECQNLSFNHDIQKYWVDYPTCGFQCINKASANCNLQTQYFNN
jgi:hypothetical protein